MIFKLAWRNIWRNKRRTAITLGMIFIAVVLSTLMMSIKEGVYENMIKSTAGDFSGYAQVHLDGYWDDKTLDYAFEMNDSFMDAIADIKEIDGALPRIESFAMVAADEVTKGSMVIGIDPEQERIHTHLDERVVEGSYLVDKDNGILVGKGLADYLEVAVDDTLVLLGAGYQGMTAVGKYPIRGIVKFGSPELSKRLIFLPMNEAHVFFGTYGLITSVVLKTGNSAKGVKGASKLAKSLNTDYEVMNWMELNPELVNMIKTDRTEGYVFMFILYMVILFGIFGTMLMMLAERRREFGVLVAVGMKRSKLALMVWIEIIIMAVLGSLVGIVGAFPTCYYLHANPIQYSEEMAKMAEEYGMEAVLKASLAPEIFIQQAIVVALIASLAAIYPLFKLQRLNAVEEMRS